MKANYQNGFSDWIKRSGTVRILLLVFCCAVLLPACASPPRRANPMTEDLSGQIPVLGQPRIRAWGDAAPRAFNELVAAHTKSAALKKHLIWKW